MTLFSKTALRNLLAVGGFLAFSTVYVVHDGLSNSGGVTGAAKGDGCICHGGGVPNTETVVTISTASQSFEPGLKYTFTVTVQNSTASAAGVNIAKKLSGSTFTAISGQGLQKRGTELVHGSPKTIVAGTHSWNFEYTAPSQPGFDTIYAVANAVDGSGNADGGDQWNFATPFAVTVGTNAVSPRTDIADGFAIGPNPASNFTKLYFSMKKPADLRIALLDASGRDVFVQNKQDIAAGRGEAMIDLASLPSGDYLVNVSSGGSMLYTGKVSRLK